MKSLILCLLLSTYVSAKCTLTTPCTPLNGGQMYEKMPQVVSSDGSLSTSLSVDINEFSVDWLTVKRRLYNGAYTGPTIRIRAGDKVNLNLINNLEYPDFEASMNLFQHPNTTNLHTHGLHISSEGRQDNPSIRVRPQEAYTYNYEIHPQQPSGTFWYHPHTHGSVHFQILSGMSGMLIVEDDPNLPENEAVSAVSCPNNCDKEVQIVFQSFQYANDDDAAFTVFQNDIGDDQSFRLNNIQLDGSSATLEEWLEDPANDIRYVLVNGKLQPQMSMKAAELHRFRFVNAIGVHSLALSLENENGDKCSYKEIALDGIYLPQPRVPRFGRSLLISGGRLDWFVICEKPGTYQLRSQFKDVYFKSLVDHPAHDGVLMTIVVEGDVMPATLPPLPYYFNDLSQVSEDEISGRFTVEVTPTDTMNREDFSGRYYRAKSIKNTVQEWHFVNTEFETSHPVHMHMNHMQIVSYNKYTGPIGVGDDDGNWKMYSQTGQTCDYQHKLYDENIDIEFPSEAIHNLDHEIKYEVGDEKGFGYQQVGEWRDTLLIPPLGNITVRFVTDSYAGDVMIHCHLTGDEDQGMMLVTRIAEEGEEVDYHELSGDAAPGSCMKDGDHSGRSYQKFVFKFISTLKSILDN